MKRVALAVALLIGLTLPAAAQPFSKAECREFATALQEAANSFHKLRETAGATTEGWDLFRGRVPADLQRDINEAQAATGELQRALNNIIAIYDDVAQGFRACSR